MDSRIVRGAAKFDDEMAGAFDGAVPVVTRHVFVETYDRGDGLARSVTVGMSRFGLPDVVVNGHRVGQRRAVAWAVNGVCQWVSTFATRSGGTEWMWLEVTAWKGSVLSGPLANVPEDVPELHEGAWVSVEQAKVFDYLFHRADGTEEGNTTAKLLAP